MQLSVREGPPQKPSPQGPHPPRSLSVGDGALLQARPPDLERLWGRSPQPVEVKAFGFILEPRLRGIHSLRASACMSFKCTSGKVCLQSLPPLESGTTNPNHPWPKHPMSVSDGGLDIYSTPERMSEMERPYGEEVERALDPEFSVFLFHHHRCALAAGCGCSVGWSELSLSVCCGFLTCRVLFWCLKEGLSLGKMCLFLHGALARTLSIWLKLMKACRK